MATPAPSDGEDSPRFGRRYLVRLLLWSLSGDVFSKAVVLGTVLIVGRSVSPQAFGQYVGLSATSVLAASVWDAGVAMLLTREFAAGSLSTRTAVLRAALLRGQTLILWLGIFATGIVVLGRGSPLPPAVVLAWAGASLAFGVHAVLLALLRARLQFRAAGVAAFSGRLATGVASLLALPALALPHTPLILALAACAGELVTLGLAAAAVRRRTVPPPGPIARPARVTLRAALPFAANAVLSTAYNRFDVVILAALTSTAQLGSYAPATRVQDALYAIPSAIGAISLPVVAGAGSGASRQVVARLTLIGLVIGLPVAAVLALTAPAVLPLALGREYANAATATRIMVWSLPAAAIGAPLLGALAGGGRAGDTTKAFAAAFTVAAALHVLLDPTWGATGAAVASLTRDVANVLLAAWFVRRAGVLDRRSTYPMRDNPFPASDHDQRVAEPRGSEAQMKREAFVLLWPLTWPLRTYLARSPMPRGKGFVTRRLLRPLLPDPPAGFISSLPGGGRLRLHYQEELGLVSLIYGGVEVAETRSLCAYARPGTTVMDVGANMGLFTIPLARAVGPEGRVLAFEPLPANVERLRENVRLNALTNVDVHPIAAGDRRGEVTLHLADDPAYASTTEVTHQRGTGAAMTVPAASLDYSWQRAGCPPVSAMKIDVEGGELTVLAGAEAVLAACRPVLLVEANTPSCLERLTQWLSRHGYTVTHPPGFMAWNYLFLREEHARGA